MAKMIDWLEFFFKYSPGFGYSPGNFDKKLQNWIKAPNLPQMFPERPQSILDMVPTWVPEENPDICLQQAEVYQVGTISKINQEVKVNNCANFAAFIHFCSRTSKSIKGKN